MAKIHKSAVVHLDSAKPVIVRGRNCTTNDDGYSVIESRTSRIMSDAQTTADHVIETAQLQAQEIFETARNEGYQDGRNQAKQEMAMFQQHMRQTVHGRLEETDTLYQTNLDNLQAELLELGLQIAEKILGLELSRNDSAFIGLVGDAMSRFKQGEKVNIQISKNDYWRSLVSSVYASTGMAEEINLMIDDNLPDGSCIIESSAGIVDASVTKQFEKICAVMLETSQEVAG